VATRRRRRLLATVATLAVLGPLVWFWQDSLMPGTYSVAEMGYADYGGGPRPAAMHDMDGHQVAGTEHGTSVTDLVTDASREADVTVDLVAREGRFRLASGRTVDGYTFNGSSPGPQITARVGQLVEVHVRNASVEKGITVHWHGVDVPNGEDGVAGVTQDAIGKGEAYTYRFVADQVGTYWYHSHQLSNTQVRRGLFGALVVLPAQDDGRLEVPAVAHTYGGVRTLNGAEGTTRVEAADGQVARVRVVNTDNGSLRVWAGSAYRVLAVDGYDVNVPTPVTGKGVDVPAGARVDVEVTAPARVQVGSATAILVGDAGDLETPAQPSADLDLLSYGTPGPLPFDPAAADRHFGYSIGRKPGFIDGRPGFWWSVNGHLWPDVPMFTVEKGDVVVFRIESHSGTHPMHLHGHHAVVLSRNGEKATGSPWWIDSLDVRKGETYEIAFRADNPGIWMDHCHQLKHASQGLLAHLMYAGVTTPFKLGDDSGNDPE
jgi:FtsP/CotA-like multicopper oxidase with cupredoxin domain